MKVTSPEGIQVLINKSLDTILTKFEEKIKELRLVEKSDFIQVTIDGEYSESLLNKVRLTYKIAGWGGVFINTDVGRVTLRLYKIHPGLLITK